jgi:HEAT repeats
MCKTLTLLNVLVLCGVVSGREWKDATGRHSIEADFVEAKVTLRLPTGQTRTVDMKTLSAVDQQFILKRVGEPNVPANNPPPAKQLPQLVADLEAAVSVNDKAKIVAATKAISHTDPTCKDAKRIVEQIPKEDSARDPALWILDEVGSDATWAADILLSMDKDLDSDKYRFRPNSIYGIDLDQPKLTFELDRLETQRESIRLLAVFYSKDGRVKQVLDKRIEQLKSAPTPQVRAMAAFCLSRAMAISGKVLPALQVSAKGDADPMVRLAAMFSLGGFGNAAKPAIPIVVDGYEKADNKRVQFNLLLSLATIQSDGPQLKKIANKAFEDYKHGKGQYWDRTPAVCKMLQTLQAKGSWAVSQLLEVAEYRLGLGKKIDELRNLQVDFEPISDALMSIGVGDIRVVKFYERAAKEGLQKYRVQCDSAAKQLRPLLKP